MSVVDEIIKLKELLDSDAITNEEYSILKSNLLNNQNDSCFYKIILVKGNQLKGFLNNLNYVALISRLAETDISQSKLPAIIGTGLTKEECNTIQIRLSPFGCETTIEEDFQSFTHNDYLMTRDLSNLPGEERIAQNAEQPRCPKCGSTSITTGARGVNWKLGLIGASKTVNRCGNCGHTWTPHS